jgi:hypothetical protein
VLLLATGAGLAVASIYYSQPMLGVLAGDLGASARGTAHADPAGLCAGHPAAGAAGRPLRPPPLILLKAVLLAVALLASGLAPGLPALLAASLVVGLTATMAQDIVPAAATWRPKPAAAASSAR